MTRPGPDPAVTPSVRRYPPVDVDPTGTRQSGFQVASPVTYGGRSPWGHEVTLVLVSTRPVPALRSVKWRGCRSPLCRTGAPFGQGLGTYEGCQDGRGVSGRMRGVVGREGLREGVGVSGGGREAGGRCPRPVLPKSDGLGSPWVHRGAPPRPVGNRHTTRDGPSTGSPLDVGGVSGVGLWEDGPGTGSME